jgi:hypothetical protein
MDITYSFADRDTAMRYYWGFAVGHAYAHSEETGSIPTTVEDPFVEDADTNDPGDALESDSTARHSGLKAVEVEEDQIDPGSPDASDSEEVAEWGSDEAEWGSDEEGEKENVLEAEDLDSEEDMD